MIVPLIYTIDKKQNAIFTVASGTLTDQELIEHKERLRNDPHVSSGMVELSDVRNIEKLMVTPSGIEEFVMQDAHDADLCREHRLAIVVSQDLAFGMGRMYEMMTSENLPNVGIFRDMEEAANWLGLSGDGS
jgi:hypothetical protein